MLRNVMRKFSYKLPGNIVATETGKDVKGFVPPTEIYKPVQQIEFDSKGETLVYSANPSYHYSVFFPMPWSIGTWTLPVISWELLAGNISFSLPLVIGMYCAILPHTYYLYNLWFHIDKIWYIRGGSWKIENSGVHGVLLQTLTGTDNLSIVSGDSNLNEDGSLSSDLVINAETWNEIVEARDDCKLTVIKKGTVHNPELFQAMLKKIKIDDSNFVINPDPENSLVSSKCIGK